MDLKSVIFVCFAIINCICAALLSPNQGGGAVADYNQIPEENSLDVTQLEHALRQDIIFQLKELAMLERQLKSSLVKAQDKKRQLEIRKREPVQCLVNIVSCWRRK